MAFVRSAAVVGVAAVFSPVSASAIEGAPGVPASTTLRPVCAGTSALLSCDVEEVVSNGTVHTAIRGTSPIGWGGTDLERPHQVPTVATGKGTVAVIDVGADPGPESDLATYRAQYPLPACGSTQGCFQQLDYHGGPAPVTTTDDKSVGEAVGEETSLDVDMVSAGCPGCHVMEVQIPDSEVPSKSAGSTGYDNYVAAFATAVRTAVADGANAISIGYALPGDAVMVQEGIAGVLDQRGVAITAASGDGYFTGNDYAWPWVLPTVISVGGTTMVRAVRPVRRGCVGTGGFRVRAGGAPAIGQPTAVSFLCGGTRTSTDVSAVADSIATYDTYMPASAIKLGWTVLAGTSASAPFVANLYAAAGHLANVHGPNTLYPAPSAAFHDVTSGTNGAIGTSTGSASRSAARCPGPRRRSRTGCARRGPAGTDRPDRAVHVVSSASEKLGSINDNDRRLESWRSDLPPGPGSAARSPVLVRNVAESSLT